jgi:hypothetical protein
MDLDNPSIMNYNIASCSQASVVFGEYLIIQTVIINCLIIVLTYIVQVNS